MNNINNNRCSGTAGHIDGCRDCAMSTVLRMEMRDLRYTHRPFHDICVHLSPPDMLQDFAGECGLSTQEWRTYDAMIRINPTELPAKTFLGIYFQQNNTTLRDFMKVLLRLRPEQHRMQQLVTALWNAALYENSPYFRNLINN